MSQRWMFVAVSLTAFVASACQVLLPDDDPDAGGAIYNDTDETVFIYAAMAGGGQIHGDAPLGETKAGCRDGRAHSSGTLAHGGLR